MPGDSVGESDLEGGVTDPEIALKEALKDLQSLQEGRTGNVNLTDAEGAVSASGKRLTAWLCTRDKCLWKCLQYRTNIPISPTFPNRRCSSLHSSIAESSAKNVSSSLWWRDF